MPAAPPTACKVYTPRPLAAALVSVLGDHPDAEWLEPCVGEGVFISVLTDVGVQPERITAIDLELTPGPEDSAANTLRGIDFLHWASTTEQRFDRIVANPPFVSLSKLESELRKAALQIVSPNGQRVVLSSNYWQAFLSASLALLRPNGNLAFVLPASWDYADYASAIKSEISESFERVEIYRSNRPLFESVQEGSIVLIAFGFGSVENQLSRFEFTQPRELIEALEKRRSAIPPIPKHGPRTSQDITCLDSVRLGDIIDIRLGGVTGAAHYFLLNECQRLDLGLPVKSLRPVLSKARHLIASEITNQEWQFLRDQGQRIWLLDPTPAQLRHSAVKDYLDSLTNTAIRERYKIKTREPWYRTPLPRNCQGFVSGMSRHGPWISLNMVPRLTATNTLYTITFREVTSLDAMCAWALTLITSESRETLLGLGRVYADGLIKYEPGSLSNLQIRRPKKIRRARQAYRQAIEFLLSGDAQAASQIADAFCLTKQ